MKKHFDAMKKAGLSLAFFALISVLLVAITNNLTHQKIIDNQAKMLLLALNEVVPSDKYDNDLIKSKYMLSATETGFERDTSVYLATQKGTPKAVIFEITTLKGYSGAITLLLGVDAKTQRVTGVRIVKHKETPGLGDKMETRKSDWVYAFNEKSLDNTEINRWHVKKDGGDFDQFTGATITPRAIVNAVRSTLLFAQKNMIKLFSPAPKSTSEVNTHD
ncbi:MAG: electron transport complex subunit RsxG [Cocleimonas sp.]